MKKIFLVVFMMCFASNVYAQTYTDYSDFGPYTDDEKISDDLTDVKIERRYKYYKNNKILGPYNTSINDEYPFMDMEDYIYSDYSDWSENVPELIYNRDISTKQIYKYLKASDINEIVISGIDDVFISNVKVYDGAALVNFDVNMENCNLKQGSEVHLKLEKSIAYDRLKIMVYLGDNNDEIKKIGVSFYKDGIFSTHSTMSIKANSHSMAMTSWFPSSNFETYYSNEMLVTNMTIKYVDEVTFYKYRDKLYRLYKLEKEYYDDYLTSGYEDYIYKDENNYKDYYAYRTRELLNNAFSDNSLNNQDIINYESTNSDNSLNNQGIINYEPTKLNNISNGDKINKQISKMDYKPLKLIKKTFAKKENNNSFKIFVISLVIVIIIILLLSKYYKKKKKCARVKKVMLC